MLVQINELERVVAAVAAELAHAHILRYWMESFRREEPPSGILLTDNPDNPTLMVLQAGAQVFALAQKLEGYRRIADDLLNERISQDPAWPDKAVKGSWDHWVLARGFFLNSHLFFWCLLGLHLGFNLCSWLLRFWLREVNCSKSLLDGLEPRCSNARHIHKSFGLQVVLFHHLAYGSVTRFRQDIVNTVRKIGVFERMVISWRWHLSSCSLTTSATFGSADFTDIQSSCLD